MVKKIGQRERVYSVERARAVKRRVNNGEYLKDVCADMGMDPKNFARFCRYNGIKIFTKKALKANYERRGQAQQGQPRSRNKKASARTDKIENLIKKGKKDREISELIGVTRQYVNYLRRR